MSSFKRKVARDNTVYEKEVEEARTQKGFLDFVIKEASCKWLDFNVINVLVMLAFYLIVSLTIEQYLRTITTTTTAIVLSHGFITSLLVVLFFSYVKKKEDATIKQVLVRYLIFGVFFGLGTFIVSLFM